MTFAPLSGIRVVDASRVLAAPSCAAHLADLGAEVIRVEHPIPQDELRFWLPHKDGVSAPFNAVNHSKQSLALDLAAAGGIDVLKRLLGTADVFIENFRPGTLERFGLGWDDLQALNPRLIYCSVRAFPTGTTREKMPGYEASTQAVSGIMSVTGENGQAPVRCGPSVVDLSTGFVSTAAILAALLDRGRTGKGMRVEPALLRTATNLLSYQVAGYSLAGVLPQRHGSGHDALVPYRVFETADGPIFIAGGNDRLWAKFAALLGVLNPDGTVPWPALAERTKARQEVDALVAGKLAGMARGPLLERLAAEGIPAQPVNTLAELFEDGSLLAAGVLHRVPLPNGQDITLAGAIFGAEGFRPDRHAAPEVGEHSQAVLTGLGYSADEIAAMRAAKTIG